MVRPPIPAPDLRSAVLWIAAMFVISRTALLLISHIALLVHVPAAVAKSGRLIVHPHIDKPAAPRQLGPSDDFRQLGVFLTSLDLAAVEPGAETPNTSH